MIKQLQKTAVMRNAGMAAATMVDAQADAMRNAASNPNGSMMGFMGMNFAANAGGVDAQQLFAQQSVEQQRQQQANRYVEQQEKQNVTNAVVHNTAWECSCGAVNNGNFCQQCGKQRPETTKNSNGSWFCQQCGTKNTGNFCQQCGTPRVK